ncbi:MAG: hypothetical protein QOK48_1258 [Blastocatellia bacterium]|jgi:hypothetical protein|nr:hypothetical protein [Blastocatellia bacterium]
MPTESGDQKTLGNYRQLIDLVSADTNYNPANADITKAALAAHYTAAQAALDDVAATSAPNKMATSDRHAAYDPPVQFVEAPIQHVESVGHLQRCARRRANAPAQSHGCAQDVEDQTG